MDFGEEKKTGYRRTLTVGERGLPVQGYSLSCRERKLLDVLHAHLFSVIVLLAVLLSMLARISVRGFISGDMHDCLLPWYNEIREGGGLKALKENVGNYNVPYQTLIALFSYLPTDPLHLYKFSSGVFDYLLVLIIMRMVFDLGQSQWRQVIACVAVAFLPTVFLNSAVWGQCDSIYCFFCLLTLSLMREERYLPAFIAYGVAFSFKLQAVFLMPFMLFEYAWQRRFSLLNFLIIPVTMILMSLPGLLYGRNFLDIFGIYVGQTQESRKVSFHYPSIWNLLSETGEARFEVVAPLALAVTFFVLLIFMALLFDRRPHLNGSRQLQLAALFSYTCVFFLPAMHERYDYLPVLLYLVLALVQPRFLPAIVGLELLNLQTYGDYLFSVGADLETFLPLLNLACYLYCSAVTLRGVLHDSAPGEKREAGRHSALAADGRHDLNKHDLTGHDLIRQTGVVILLCAGVLTILAGDFSGPIEDYVNHRTDRYISNQVMRRYVPDRIYELKIGGQTANLGDGWSGPETDSTWAVSDCSAFYLYVEETDQDGLLQIETAQDLKYPRTLVVNDVNLGAFDSPEDAILQIAVPAGVLQAGVNRFEIRTSAEVIPFSEFNHESGDRRELNLFVRTIALCQNVTPEQLAEENQPDGREQKNKS